MTDAIIALLSLIALEVILGIDNIIFISILADKLPDQQRNKLRYWGIGLAMVMRLLLLAVISWILKLDQTLFTLFETKFSGKGLILIFGGLFLIYKATKEIYHKTEQAEATPGAGQQATFSRLLGEIIVPDLVFSFKILALCFLLLIGVSLLAEGFSFEIPKGYIYFSMAFAFLVDIIQMKTVGKKVDSR